MHQRRTIAPIHWRLIILLEIIAACGREMPMVFYLGYAQYGCPRMEVREPAGAPA
jgi:hypothetical protein